MVRPGAAGGADSASSGRGRSRGPSSTCGHGIEVELGPIERHGQPGPGSASTSATPTDPCSSDLLLVRGSVKSALRSAASRAWRELASTRRRERRDGGGCASSWSGEAGRSPRGRRPRRRPRLDRRSADRRRRTRRRRRDSSQRSRNARASRGAHAFARAHARAFAEIGFDCSRVREAGGGVPSGVLPRRHLLVEVVDGRPASSPTGADALLADHLDAWRTSSS